MNKDVLKIEDEEVADNYTEGIRSFVTQCILVTSW